MINTSDVTGAGMSSAQIKSLNNDMGGNSSQIKILDDTDDVSMTLDTPGSARGAIENSASSMIKIVCPINITSLSHVLLPLALHPLTSIEFQKKDHLTLLQVILNFIPFLVLF